MIAECNSCCRGGSAALNVFETAAVLIKQDLVTMRSSIMGRMQYFIAAAFKGCWNSIPANGECH